MSTEKKEIILTPEEIDLATYRSYQDIVNNNFNPDIAGKTISRGLYRIYHLHHTDCYSMVVGFVNSNGKVFLHGNPGMKHIPSEPNLQIIARKQIMFSLDDKNRASVHNNLYKAGTSIGMESYKYLSRILPIKIKSSELSARIFGLKTAKESLVGEVIKDYEILMGTSVKMDRETLYVSVPYKEKSIKFSLSDVEFVFPNLKGYSAPKDKTIRMGSMVRIIGQSDVEHVVLGILPDKNSKRISKRCDNRQKDVVTIANGNRTQNIHAKYLKLSW